MHFIIGCTKIHLNLSFSTHFGRVCVAVFVCVQMQIFVCLCVHMCVCLWSSSCSRGSAKVDTWSVLKNHGIRLRETQKKRETVTDAESIFWSLNRTTSQRLTNLRLREHSQKTFDTYWITAAGYHWLKKSLHYGELTDFKRPALAGLDSDGHRNLEINQVCDSRMSQDFWTAFVVFQRHVSAVCWWFWPLCSLQTQIWTLQGFGDIWIRARFWPALKSKSFTFNGFSVILCLGRPHFAV